LQVARFLLRNITMTMRRFTLAAACAIVLAPFAGISVLTAQPVVVNVPPGTLPKSVPTTATVTIGGAFSIVPVAPALTQTSQQGNPCNPGACFTGSVQVNANQGWQLQVRVKPTAPATFYVNWLTATDAQVRLSTNWYSVRNSATGITNSTSALRFNANKVTGKTGVMPTAAQLSSYLEFRVIAFP
jgi:hypothetical protein